MVSLYLYSIECYVMYAYCIDICTGWARSIDFWKIHYFDGVLWAYKIDENVCVHFLSFVLYFTVWFNFFFLFFPLLVQVYVCTVWKSLSIRLSVTLSLWKLHVAYYLFIYEQAIFETFFLRFSCLFTSKTLDLHSKL